MSQEQSQDTHEKSQPSGPNGDKPSTHQAPDPVVHSATPENAEGKLKPSAPGETGTTPGTDWK